MQKIWLVLLLWLLFPMAGAKELECTAAEPCSWLVDVHASGFVANSWSYNTGDVVTLTVYNADELDAHTVSLTDFNITLDVGPQAAKTSQPFQFTAPGSFTLIDATAGSTGTVTISGDAIGTSSTSTARKPGLVDDTPSEDSSLGFVAALALLGAAFLRRTV